MMAVACVKNKSRHDIVSYVRGITIECEGPGKVEISKQMGDMKKGDDGSREKVECGGEIR